MRNTTKIVVAKIVVALCECYATQSLTILVAISRSMFFAALTPTGSPSMRMQSFFSVSGGMMMDVPVSVLMRLTNTGTQGHRDTGR